MLLLRSDYIWKYTITFNLFKIRPNMQNVRVQIIYNLGYTRRPLKIRMLQEKPDVVCVETI